MPVSGDSLNPDVIPRIPFDKSLRTVGGEVKVKRTMHSMFVVSKDSVGTS